MSIKLDFEYDHHLREAKPLYLKEQSIRPKGALGDIRVVPEQRIPPINTDIRFSMLAPMTISTRPDLVQMDETVLPEKFNWFDDGGSLTDIMIKSSNQMLCGSCWAIASTSIVANNHVVAGTVNWEPRLSTTYCLACYPQLQCKGGNPAQLLQDISKGGVATKACVDYSWCALNENCNGKATQHFKAGEELDLSALVPPCGCYNSEQEHYLYFIDTPENASIGKGGLNETNFAVTVKKHIYKYGPVLGGFLVFDNFMHGTFTKVNQGIYLENGIYDKGELHFDDNYLKDTRHYKGSHAVEIIGWGIAHDVVVDNQGTRKSVPYWECVNSWTEKWGNDGRFRMAMYPFNKICQFDKMVQIVSPSGTLVGGGMVLVKATQKPKKVKLQEMNSAYLQQNLPLLEKPACYTGEPDQNKCSFTHGSNPVGSEGSGSSEGSTNKNTSKKLGSKSFLLIFLVILFLAMGTGTGLYFYQKRKNLKR